MKCREFESLIDSYLKGTIPEERRDYFEEHYFICDHCYTALVIAENLRIKKVRIVPEGKKRRTPVLRPVLLAASLLIIVFASLFYTGLNNRKEKLFELSRFSPPLYVKGENRGDPLTGPFHEAMQDYHHGEYKRAYRLIRTVDSGNSQIWYFRGILALLNGDSQYALEQFNHIVSAMSPSYYDEALYYRGICYLRLNRKGKALKEFRTLESMHSPLREKASEMVRKISSL